MINSDVNQKFVLNTQYLKDISFENPNPIELYQSEVTPSIGVQIDINVISVDEDVYEVSLIINAEASIKDAKAFIIELTYAGLFTVKGVDDDVLEQLLLINCPTLLFPFARQIISSTADHGRVGPLFLDPVDFFQLYMKKKNNDHQEM